MMPVDLVTINLVLTTSDPYMAMVIEVLEEGSIQFHDDRRCLFSGFQRSLKRFINPASTVPKGLRHCVCCSGRQHNK